MARGRMIDQSIRKSEKLAALKTDRAKVIYFMIYPHLDCEGRFSGDPNDIRDDCVPRLRYSVRQIAEAVIDLDRVGLVCLYEADGKPYLEFARFADFQSLRKDREAPSRIPAYSGLTPEDSGRTPALYLYLSLRKEGKNTNSKSNILFNAKAGQFINISEEIKSRWKLAYPACDIELCLRQAAEWLCSNPTKAKSNYQRFLTNWLKKEQDRGGTGTRGQKEESSEEFSERHRKALRGE